MADSQIIYPLALVTLVLALAIAAWIYLRTQRARRTGEPSEMNKPGMPRTEERKQS